MEILYYQSGHMCKLALEILFYIFKTDKRSAIVMEHLDPSLHFSTSAFRV